MLVFNLRFIILLIIFQLIYFHEVFTQNPGNPISEGWYADPEGTVLGDQYWIFPTYSAKYEEQTFFDAFSSIDMIYWQKHSKYPGYLCDQMGKAGHVGAIGSSK
ncbi:MAG: hypothetical protein IPP89_08555 [Saprospiraceae bacterium]|nr:hypothetical protein [Candidatus Brachybacter algidus]MBL0119021.1 hypothetical protein [Candidatus Brachybacter algidus]